MRALRGLVGSGGSKVGASKQKGEGGNRSVRQAGAENPDKISEIFAIWGHCGVCARVNKWWATRTASRTNTGQGHALLSLISTGYGTVTGELHPPPRQGNARLTSSPAPLNIIDRPVSPSPSPSPSNYNRLFKQFRVVSITPVVCSYMISSCTHLNRFRQLLIYISLPIASNYIP